MNCAVKLISCQILFCLLLNFASSLDSAEFVVKIGHYTLPNLETTKIQCSGTIVSSRHVLTAASCVRTQISEGISIVQSSETNPSEANLWYRGLNFQISLFHSQNVCSESFNSSKLQISATDRFIIEHRAFTRKTIEYVFFENYNFWKLFKFSKDLLKI